MANFARLERSANIFQVYETTWTWFAVNFSQTKSLQVHVPIQFLHFRLDADFVDGGVGANCPANVVLKWLAELEGLRGPCCLLSFGCGIPRTLPPDTVAGVKAALEIVGQVSDANEQWRHAEPRAREATTHGERHVMRMNYPAESGIGEFPLNVGNPTELAVQARLYLDSRAGQSQIRQAASLLLSQCLFCKYFFVLVFV